MQREKQINVPLSREEYSAIKKLAKKLDKKRAAVMRELAMAMLKQMEARP